MASKKLDTSRLLETAGSVARKVRPYSLLIFLLFIAAAYGIVLQHIRTLDNIQPSSQAISSQNNPTISAGIDKAAVKQLESLRDNSVNVQAFFEQSRTNPFQD